MYRLTVKTKQSALGLEPEVDLVFNERPEVVVHHGLTSFQMNADTFVWIATENIVSITRRKET